MHEPDDKKRLGARLAEARDARDLSQSEAAELLGITKAGLSAWEVGRNLPDALMLGRVARIYETTADALLGGEQITLIGKLRAALEEAEAPLTYEKRPDDRIPPDSPIRLSKALKARRRAIAERVRPTKLSGKKA